MNQRVVPALSWLFVFIVMAAPWPSKADALPLACQVAVGQADLASRTFELSSFEGLSEDCLKSMFMHCSAASEKNVLGMGTVMACSVAYEALLKRVFRGDFEKLLAWWRTQGGSGSVSAAGKTESPIRRGR